MAKSPTPQEILKGYERFNAWESQEQRGELSQLTVEESLTQYFSLCALARALAPRAEQVFLEQDRAHWSAMREKIERAARVMSNAATVGSTSGSEGMA